MSVDERLCLVISGGESLAHIIYKMVSIKQATETQRNPDDWASLLYFKLTQKNILNSTK